VLLMLDAGVIHHVGPHRLHVKLARHLAAQGVASLRFDFSGLGDSQRPVQGAAADLAGAQRDVRDVIDAVTARLGPVPVALLGLCSGAVHAQATAVADARVRGVFLIDGHAYPSWRGRWQLLRAMRRAYGSAGLAARLTRWTSIKAWHQLRPPEQQPGLLDEDALAISPAQFDADMQVLCQRGVAVQLWFTGSVMEVFAHPLQLRDRFPGAQWLQAVQCQVEPSVDHTFTLAASQRCLIEAVTGWLDRLVAPAAAES
jgi:hypothetical protein